VSVGVGVVGLGFMGRTHLDAYRAAGATLVGVCDGDPARLTGEPPAGGNLGDGAGDRLFDPAAVVATSDLDELLSAPGLELVSVCTPTDTHADVARRVIAAGKHVLVEKPVALDAEAVLALGAEAEAAGVLCMPAMCMRFWPAWAWTREAIAGGRLGAVRAARFERLGGRPAWGGGFYEDEARSGGALFDLHVHDTDFVVHLFGVPEAVVSAGDTGHATTLYRYAGGPAHVVAEGGWMPGDSWPFTMRLVVELERGVIDFELGRDPELRVHHASGELRTPEVSPATGWEAEIAAMVGAVARGDRRVPATMRSAAASTAVLEAERESLRTGRPAVPRDPTRASQPDPSGS
jgi:predicted dehydrogenase